MNYWYLSRIKEYPEGKWLVRSVQLKKRFTIIEMRREANERELFECDLVYLGHGWWNDEHIQENYLRYERLVNR